MGHRIRLPFIVGFFVQVCVFIATSTVAAGEEFGRAAKPDELAGIWEMVGMKVSVNHDPQDSFYARYQKFHFSTDGKMKVIASHKAFDRNSEAAFSSAPFTASYELDEKGFLRMNNPGWPGGKGCIAVYVLSDRHKGKADLPQPGDIRLAWLDPAGRPVIIKVLRRIAGR